MNRESKKVRNVGPFVWCNHGTVHGRCTNTGKSSTTLQTRINFPPTTWRAISNALWELCCEAQIHPFPIISKHCWMICASCRFPSIITDVSFFPFSPGKNLPQLHVVVVSLCLSKLSQNAISFGGHVPGLPALYIHKGCPEFVSEPVALWQWRMLVRMHWSWVEAEEADWHWKSELLL